LGPASSSLSQCFWKVANAQEVEQSNGSGIRLKSSMSSRLLSLPRTRIGENHWKVRVRQNPVAAAASVVVVVVVVVVDVVVVGGWLDAHPGSGDNDDDDVAASLSGTLLLLLLPPPLALPSAALDPRRGVASDEWWCEWDAMAVVCGGRS
jgi:hypothetical protein